ncbi:CHAT domain-containing protein [Mycena latifolia]|nr:CHAT domain-containing protein [Mycena latifolia]
MLVQAARGSAEDLVSPAQNGSETDVSEDSILKYQGLINQTPPDHPDLPSYYWRLGEIFRNSYEHSEELKDLNDAVQTLQIAVNHTPKASSESADRLKSLALALTRRYRRLGNLADLESALQNYKEAVDVTLKENPARPRHLTNYSVSLLERYQRLGDLGNLEGAMQTAHEAVDLTAERHPEMSNRLQNLALCLSERYQRLGDLKDLDASLQTNQKAVALTPDGDPDMPSRLQNLSVSFLHRYQRLGDQADLEVAVQNQQKTIDLTPQGHPVRPTRLHNLALSLSEQYKSFGNPTDLELALQKEQEAVNLIAVGDSARPILLQNLGVLLAEQFRRLGNLKDLEDSIEIRQEALQLTPHNHPGRAHQLQSLAKAQEAVDIMKEGHPDMPDLLQNLAVSLSERYRRLGNPEDLETALLKNQDAIGLTPEGHPDMPVRLQNLATTLLRRYQRLGDLRDLDGALQQKQKAVKLAPEGHPDRPGFLANFAVSLLERYDRLGDLKDLEGALQNNQKALDLTPAGHPTRPSRLQNLAVSFSTRYKRLGDQRDLEAALHAGQEAHCIIPKGHPSRQDHLHNLAALLSDRYQRLGDLKDLESSLQMTEEALDLTPDGHPARPAQLQNLAVSLADQYQRSKDLKCLEGAVQKGQEAVDLTPEGHPDRPRYLQNLAVILIYCYQRSGNMHDLEVSLAHSADSFKTCSSTPHDSWTHALQWASVAKQFRPSDCSAAYTAAFRLLPELLWIGHSIPVRHEIIHRLDIGQVTSTAFQTCISLANFASAVESMEQGLATIFQQILQLKTDVDALRPDQAKRFRELSSELYGGTSDNSTAVAINRNELLEDIRKQPGLEYFLLPKPYTTLRQASLNGPIVILNSHKASCDGMIILYSTSEPIHVPLPQVTLELLKSQKNMLKALLDRCSARFRGESVATRLFGQQENFTSKTTQECFEDVLSWLWTHIVYPVYQALEQHGIYSGRLWWLPTGTFTGLPLHACPPTDNFIHSYTATLGSLLASQSKKYFKMGHKFGVVGVTHTGIGAMNFLKGVGEEAKNIVSIIKDVECLEGAKATVDAVKNQLQDCSWVHLACHGTQNLVEPTKSCLLLHGGKLELETMLRIPLPNAQFVFLAACQTAMGDPGLVNESFHLGGGFIAAGFRGAVGTLWSINDADGPRVAQSFYSHLFRGGRRPQASDAAEALHYAVKELKTRKSNLASVRASNPDFGSAKLRLQNAQLFTLSLALRSNFKKFKLGALYSRGVSGEKLESLGAKYRTGGLQPGNKASEHREAKYPHPSHTPRASMVKINYDSPGESLACSKDIRLDGNWQAWRQLLGMKERHQDQVIRDRTVLRSQGAVNRARPATRGRAHSRVESCSSSSHSMRKSVPAGEKDETDRFPLQFRRAVVPTIVREGPITSDKLPRTRSTFSVEQEINCNWSLHQILIMRYIRHPRVWGPRGHERARSELTTADLVKTSKFDKNGPRPEFRKELQGSIPSRTGACKEEFTYVIDSLQARSDRQRAVHWLVWTS